MSDTPEPPGFEPESSKTQPTDMGQPSHDDITAADPGSAAEGQPSSEAQTTPQGETAPEGQLPADSQPVPDEQSTPFGQPPEYGPWPPYGQPSPPYGQTAPYGQPAQYAIPADQDLSSAPSPILVSFSAAAKQRRWTVAIRAIMAVPHYIALWALGIAAEVMVFIGWFAALFTGQLPAWAHTFVTGYLRWQARVYGYLLFLTDVYPPFSLEDDSYPLRLVTRRTRLNRLAVFFRLILFIPAAIVGAIAIVGVLIASFFSWLIALVAGKLPDPLYQANAAVVRYTARYYGYVFMLTSQYPWGLFGDQEVPGGAFAGGAFNGGAIAEPAAGASSDSVLSERAGPDPWRLTLSGGARGILGVMLVIGLAGYVTGVVVDAMATTTTINAAVIRGQIDQANITLGKTLSGFPSAVAACNGQLTCVTKLDRSAGQAIEAFVSAVRSAKVQGSAAADAATLANDAETAGHDFLQLGSATSVSQYQSIATSSSLQQHLNNVSADYLKLSNDLAAS